MKTDVIKKCPIRGIFHNFIICGVTGWCLEILFTAVGSLRRRDMRLMGQTSLLMFPIYGSMSFLKPLFGLLHRLSPLKRGLIYSLCIFAGEYASGALLKKRGACPWDYSRHKYHVGGIIRIDYLPVWLVAGLVFERILKKQDS